MIGAAWEAVLDALARIEHAPGEPDGVTAEEVRAQALLHHGDQQVWRIDGADPGWVDDVLTEAAQLGHVVLEGERWRLG